MAKCHDDDTKVRTPTGMTIEARRHRITTTFDLAEAFVLVRFVGRMEFHSVAVSSRVRTRGSRHGPGSDSLPLLNPHPASRQWIETE